MLAIHELIEMSVNVLWSLPTKNESNNTKAKRYKMRLKSERRMNIGLESRLLSNQKQKHAALGEA